MFLILSRSSHLYIMHSTCKSQEQFSKKTMFHLSKSHSLNDCPEFIITITVAKINIKATVKALSMIYALSSFMERK